MSIRGKHLASMMAFLLSCGSIVGCRHDEPSEEKKPVAPTVAATATAAATPAPSQTAGQEDVYEDSLVLLAEGEPDSGAAPLVVQFHVESLVVDEMVSPRYTWDFGDGSPKSSEANPSHTYEKAGEYVATVGIVDASGQRGWDEVDIVVEKPDADAAP